MSRSKLDIHGIGMTSQRTRNRLAQLLADKGIEDEDVLNIMRKIPRHLFMDEALAHRSYENTALPIGHGQTISQPFTVARMTELILKSERPLNKVLEIGTGSGYQAAVLAPFVKELFTVERIKPLYLQATAILFDLGYRNIRCYLSDGSWGLEQFAPFDSIIVTAAPEEVPESLLQQLEINGQLIIPTGAQQSRQILKVITRTDCDTFNTIEYDEVQFVPLIRDN